MPLDLDVPHVKNIEFKIGTSKVRVGAISNESYFFNNPNSSGRNISPKCISKLFPNGCKYRETHLEQSAAFFWDVKIEDAL